MILARIGKECLRLPIALLLLASLGCKSEKRTCDRYFERYEACVARMGPAMQAAIKDRLERERREIGRLSKSPEHRVELASQCEASLRSIANICP
jgi:hypothetical protein